jgi:hypothetical protein
MTVEDHEKFMAAYKNTICRSMGEYARKLLLGIPPTVTYRNRSVDDLIETAVLLRRDLLALLSKDSLTAAEKESLFRRITNLEDLLIKISEQCSH